MQLNMIISKAKKYINYELLAVFLIFLGIAAIVLWPVAANPSNTTLNGGSDLYQTLWGLWWVPYSIFTLHTTPFFTNLLYYPIGANLVSQTMLPLAAIIAAPFQAFGTIFEYNVLLFLSFALSGLFMFVLAKHITKERYSAFIAGTVFAFSSFHMAHAFAGHLDVASIEFMPLFVYLIIRMRETQHWKYGVYAGITFLLLSFGAFIQYGIMAVQIFIALAIFYLITVDRKELVTKEMGISIAAMGITILLVGAYFILPIIHTTLSGVSYAQQNATAIDVLWSTPVLSYFMPSGYNNLFSSISNSYFSIFAAGPSERVAYVGYVALALAILGLFSHVGERKDKLLWSSIVLVSAILALGPYVQITASATSIPGLFYVYTFIPIFNLIREPGRFNLFVSMGMAILAAFGSISVLDFARKRYTDENKVMAVCGILALLIVLETAGIPVGATFINNSFVTPQIPKAYGEISKIPGNYSMLFLPTLPDYTQSMPMLYQGMEMYYQTIFKKPMINGYATRSNSTQAQAGLFIPISVAAAYLKSGYGLSYPTPLTYNASNTTMFWLGVYNTKFVTVLRSAYNDSQQLALGTYLSNMFGLPVYQDNTTMIFEVNQTRVQQVANQIVPYTVGTWVPGYTICASIGCNASYNNLWWGPNIRGVDIYTRTPRPNATVQFDAAGYGKSMQVFVYLNSFNAPVKTLTVGPATNSFTINMSLGAGINQMYFASQNATSTSGQLLPNYGIGNIIISQH